MSDQLIENGVNQPEDVMPDIKSTTVLSYTGPIPPASELAKYNDIIPNAAERILAMAEADGNHRRKSEADIIAKRFQADLFGMVFAITLALLCLFASFYFFLIGNNIAGTLFLSVPVLDLIHRFIPQNKSE